MTGPDRSGATGDRSERWGFARLTKRAEFQRVAKGQRSNARCIALQTSARIDDAVQPPQPRIGLTLTRKVGNRIRRRLRAALRLTPDLDQRPTHDYVIVGRREALAADFQRLSADIARAFKAIHQPRDRDHRRSGKTSRTTAAPSGVVQG
jgi:ribonuclease P protein component